MKKRLALITLLVLFSSTMFGQYISHWGPVPTNYDNSMTLLAKIKINGEDQQSTDLEVGAFCGDELRGATKLQKVGNDYIIFLNIWSDHAYDIINFKLYNPANENVQYLSDYTVPFITNNKIGSPGNYETLDFVPSYWNKVDVVIYENTMTVNATIAIDGVSQSNRGDLEVAAFSGDELRDLQRPIYDEDSDQYVVYFVIQGRGSETVNFQLYDHSGNILHELLPLDSDYTVPFNDGDIFGQDAPVTINFISQSVAKVGEKYFTTLAEAVEEATEENNKVTLLKDAEGKGVVINKNVTIDFGGFTYTFNEGVGSTGTPSNGFQILKDNEVTLKNGTLQVSSEENVAKTFYTIIQNYANLTVEDMTLDGTNLDKWSTVENNWDSYTLSINSGNVDIKGETTIIANNEGSKAFAFDACKYANYSAPVVTLGEEVVIDGKVELSGGELYTSQEIDIVVKKEFKAGADWGTISVPVVEASIPEATAGIHDLYRYDEQSATWQYYKDGVNGGNAENPFATLKLGQGYLYANAADIELVLEGKLNFADVVFPLSYTEGNNLAGFNMVGNPFAYSIGLGNFATEASLADGFYTIGAGGAWIAQTEGQKIAPMEAVLVKADQASDMTIKAGQQQGTKRNQPKAYLAINVANSEFEDVAYVSFSEGMGLDKISHRNADVPMVSVPVDGKEYAIAIMNEDVTEIPVTFKASTIGEYTFSAEGIECEFSKLTLVDRQTGNTTNLLLEDYTFIATSNDNVNRFFLQIDNSQPSTDSSDFAYINNGMIKIDNIEGNGVVRVLDVLGRPVAEYDVQETANIPTASFANGVYMIQMMDNNGVKVQKIIID